MTNAARIFQQLIGAWCYERTIPGQARAVGDVTFTPHQTEKHTLLYSETGETTLQNGTVVSSYQKYLYRYLPADDLLVVDFVPVAKLSGRFHQLAFASDGQSAQAEHWCHQDFYQTRYVFNNIDYFTITHRVTGPEKDYMIETKYRRLTDNK